MEEYNKNFHNEIITNESIHQCLLDAIENAQTELDIMSPWITKEILTPKLRDKIRTLLKKGVEVKIAYGTDNYTDRKAYAVDEYVNLLHSRFFSGFNNFRTCKIITPGKLFICDEKYYVITSMNPLSNDGSFWEEIGEKSQNIENLRKYREKYFNF